MTIYSICAVDEQHDARLLNELFWLKIIAVVALFRNNRFVVVAERHVGLSVLFSRARRE